MTRVTAEPLKQVGKIELGAPRSVVREAADLPFKEFKKIDRLTLTAILEEVFRTALKKKYG